MASCSSLSASEDLPLILADRADRSFLDGPSGSSVMCESAISTSPLSSARLTADSLIEASSEIFTALSSRMAAAELSFSAISLMFSEIQEMSFSSPRSIL